MTLLRVNNFKSNFDMVKVLDAYGTIFKSDNKSNAKYSGQFDNAANVVMQVDDASCEAGLEFIGETDMDCYVDTPEEFLTANYLSPVKIEIKDINALKVINQELPEGAEGAIKLACLWKKRVAEVKFNLSIPEDKKKQQLANYELIQKTLREKAGVTIAQVDKYFAEAIRSEIEDYIADEFNLVNIVADGNAFAIRRCKDGFLVQDTISDYKVAAIYNVADAKKTLQAQGFSAKAIEKIVPIIVTDLIPRIPNRTFEIMVKGLTEFYAEPTQGKLNEITQMISDFLLAAKIFDRFESINYFSADALIRAVGSLNENLVSSTGDQALVNSKQGKKYSVSYKKSDLITEDGQGGSYSSDKCSPRKTVDEALIDSEYRYIGY